MADVDVPTDPKAARESDLLAFEIAIGMAIPVRMRTTASTGFTPVKRLVAQSGAQARLGLSGFRDVRLGAVHSAARRCWRGWIRIGGRVFRRDGVLR